MSKLPKGIYNQRPSIPRTPVKQNKIETKRQGNKIILEDNGRTLELAPYSEVVELRKEVKSLKNQLNEMRDYYRFLKSETQKALDAANEARENSRRQKYSPF